MPFLSVFFKLIRAVLSEASPWQVAWGFGLGMVLGLTPFWAQSLLVLLLTLALRVNFASVLAAWFLVGLISLPLAPWLATLGEAWLTHPAWQSLWTALYQSRVWQLLHFHHTLTLGSLLVALVCLLPLVLLVRWVLPPLRARINPILARFHLQRVGQAHSWYGRLAGLWQKLV